MVRRPPVEEVAQTDSDEDDEIFEDEYADEDDDGEALEYLYY